MTLSQRKAKVWFPGPRSPFSLLSPSFPRERGIYPSYVVLKFPSPNRRSAPDTAFLERTSLNAKRSGRSSSPHTFPPPCSPSIPGVGWTSWEKPSLRRVFSSRSWKNPSSEDARWRRCPGPRQRRVSTSTLMPRVDGGGEGKPGGRYSFFDLLGSVPGLCVCRDCRWFGNRSGRGRSRREYGHPIHFTSRRVPLNTPVGSEQGRAECCVFLFALP